MGVWAKFKNDECGQGVILGLARACSMPARLGNKVLLGMAEACRVQDITMSCIIKAAQAQRNGEVHECTEGRQ